MAAGLGAFALTMLFRHSVATLSLLFAYSVGGEILAVLVPVDGVGRWTLGNNVYGWLETRMEFFDPTAPCARIGDMPRLPAHRPPRTRAATSWSCSWPRSSCPRSCSAAATSASNDGWLTAPAYAGRCD